MARRPQANPAPLSTWIISPPKNLGRLGRVMRAEVSRLGNLRPIDERERALLRSDVRRYGRKKKP